MKKVTLFIVEGTTDLISMEALLSRILSQNAVRFQVVNGDLTSNINTNANNIAAKLNMQLKLCINRYHYRKEDFSQIIHLVDTDGAFIPKNCIQPGETKEPVYYSDRIETSRVEAIKLRNEHKSALLHKLCTIKQINKIPYQIFFFSSNLEHVLHDIPNVPHFDKRTLAENFSERFYGREEEFLNFIRSPEVAAGNSKKESWEFIEENTNSLERYCNFHLFFNNSLEEESM